MEWLDRLLGRTKPEERAAAVGTLDWAMEVLGAGNGSAAGVSVTPEGSLAYSAVLACVRVLAEGVASLPCLVYERTQENGREGKRRATDHPVYELLHNEPNDVQTAFELYEMGMAQLLLWGNFYAEIDWDARGAVRGLWPLPAWDMAPYMSGRKKFYQLQMTGASPMTFQDWQVLHVPSFGYDGLQGKSLIALAREAVGLGIAAQQYGASFFGNGARPGGILEHPGKLSKEAHDRLRGSWNAAHGGLTNAQRVAILEEGMKFAAVAIPPEDAQFLQTRQFQRAEVAAIFRVPPHMIGDLERATFSNIEQQSSDFYTNSLQPWLKRWEQRLMRSLLVGAERQTHLVEFLVDALLRADTTARYQAYAVGRNGGWLSANDIRERENMNPIEGGDEYLTPLNMSPVGTLPPTPSPEGEGEEEATGEASPPLPPPEEKGQDLAGRETREEREARELRSATARRRLARSYRGTMEHVAQRIVNREVNDIRKAARKYLTGKDVGAFETWAQTFDPEHSRFVRDYLHAPLVTYLRLVTAEIERELDEEIDEARLLAFGEEYVSGRRNDWMAELQRRLRQVVERAEDQAEEDWDPLGSVESWLDERQGKRAGFVAQDETVRGGNAMALQVYSIGGIIYTIWRAFGESCPLCQALDGRMTKIGEWYLPAGNELTGKDGSKFVSMGNVGHAPLHDGCDCVNLAVRG